MIEKTLDDLDDCHDKTLSLLDDLDCNSQPYL
jgi:hypothetical protein